MRENCGTMELTTQEKARLAIGSLVDSCEIFAERSGGVKRFPGYNAYFVPETFWYNRVCLNGNALTGLEAAAEEIAAGVKAGRLPPLVGWLDRDYPLEAAAPVLERAGFVPMTMQRAMYMDLAGFRPEPLLPQAELAEPREVPAWADACSRAFGKPPEATGMKLIADHPDCDFLLWREDGEIVATVLLMCRGQNGGIHEVATMPEYRRRGISNALLKKAFALAAARGCSCVTLQASEMGYPNYLRLGMEHVGDVYTWMLKPEIP